MIGLLLVAALAAHEPEATVEIAQERPQLALRVGWPARIDAIAPLGAHLRRDAARRSAEAMAAARRAQVDARVGRYPFVAHDLGVDWRIEGVTAQLVSLSAATSATQGGGHSADDYDVLLWDRLAERPVRPTALLDMPALVPRFCAAWREARAEHPGDDAGGPCPTLGGRPIAPTDSDGNGRFDTLRVLIAVNYFEAEGYAVDIPVTAADLARLPEAYRPAFERAGERPPPDPDR